MLIEIATSLAILGGIVVSPRITFSLVLVASGHPFLAVIAFFRGYNIVNVTRVKKIDSDTKSVIKDLTVPE